MTSPRYQAPRQPPGCKPLPWASQSVCAAWSSVWQLWRIQLPAPGRAPGQGGLSSFYQTQILREVAPDLGSGDDVPESPSSTPASRARNQLLVLTLMTPEGAKSMTLPRVSEGRDSPWDPTTSTCPSSLWGEANPLLGPLSRKINGFLSRGHSKALAPGSWLGERDRGSPGVCNGACRLGMRARRQVRQSPPRVVEEPPPPMHGSQDLLNCPCLASPGADSAAHSRASGSPRRELCSHPYQGTPHSPRPHWAWQGRAYPTRSE